MNAYRDEHGLEGLARAAIQATTATQTWYGTMTLEEQVADAGRARIRAEVQRSTASHYLYLAIRKAAKAGWTKTRIAEVAGVSRQTVHEILREDNR